MRMLWAVGLLAPLAWADAPSIDALQGAPIPNGLIGSPTHATLAWVENARGVRTIFAASAPTFVARALTHFRDDDGQTLSALTFSSDGRTLLFVRGSGPGGDGFQLNPTSNPDGAEQAVWAVASDGLSAPRRIADGAAPVLAPDDRHVLIERDKTLHCFALTGKPAQWCRTPLLKLRGVQHSARFSADGQTLAFVSDRGDRRFIGTLDLNARSTRWLAPMPARDGYPQWSVDGTAVEFIRFAAQRTNQTLDITSAWPFSVWRAPLNGSPALMLHASNPTAGGFAQLFSPDAPLKPTRTGALFLSEQTGFLQLWLAGANRAVNLTPGSCEIERYSLSADHTRLAYSDNCSDTHGRRIRVVAFSANGRGATLYESSGAIDVDPTLIGNGRYLAFRRADATTPMRVQVVDLDARQPQPRAISSALPRDFPRDRLVVPEQVSFRAADGLEIHGQLFVPRSNAGSKRPAIVFVHGGPIRQMLPGFHYMDYYHRDYAMNQLLAAHGYVVLAVNFRSGVGYGQAFRRAAGQGPRGASENQDVVAGAQFLAARADVDPARIGIYGGSYGGLLTAQMLARHSDLFKAGVDLHGVHDWRLAADQENGAGWGLAKADRKLAFESSPVAAIATWRSPVLLIHGDDDRAVPFNQTSDLYERLREREVPVEALVFPDEEHDFVRYDTWLKVYAATLDFFARRL
jgi:dipeptidyl aminopeptidase/acylaminoacyl peptidase